jgi:nickel-dependent lactate racemase
MHIRLAFGREGLQVQLPSGFDWRVLDARSGEALSHPEAAIGRALDNPVAGEALRRAASHEGSAAIAVCDITRPVPNRVMLPPLLERLHQGGIPREAVTIVIATGLHRAATREEIEEILGPQIAAAYRVVNHDARKMGEHRALGKTRSGTPVFIDERFMAADLHITCGLIEPHLMLGFSGGRKLIAPGMAYQDTIRELHSPRFMRDPKAVEGSLEGNTLHRELMEIAQMARHDFMLDVAITRDRGISGIFAGKPPDPHLQGTAYVSNVMMHQLDRRVDAAITTSAGYPLDLTFYQAIKGITAAAQIVRPGGRILLMAACAEGPGSADFSALLRENITGPHFLQRIAKAPVVVDQWQLEKLALVTRNIELLYFVPGLPAEYHPTLWGRTFADAQEAVSALVNGLEPHSEIAVLPDGPYVLAQAMDRSGLA